VSPYEELRLLLASLGEGEQRSGEICPHCGGGRAREGSLSIVRYNSTSGAYKCNRASCKKEGYIGERYGTHYRPPAEQVAKEWAPRIYDGTIEEISDERVKEYADKYGWTSDEIRSTGVGWSPEYQRSVWKVCSPTGFVRGIELRTLDPYRRNKTLQFRHSADPWVGYCGLYQGAGSRSVSGVGEQSKQSLVAVEDLISMHRVGQVYPAASIMGSHLNFEVLTDMMKVTDRIILCLDRDATNSAEKFARRYAFLCPGLVHIPLQRDLKYETQDSIKEILSPAIG
jgi:hypothetical protein